MYVLMYESETMVYRGKERSKINDLQMDKLRNLMGIRRIDGIANA